MSRIVCAAAVALVLLLFVTCGCGPSAFVSPGTATPAESTGPSAPPAATVTLAESAGLPLPACGQTTPASALLTPSPTASVTRALSTPAPTMTAQPTRHAYLPVQPATATPSPAPLPACEEDGGEPFGIVFTAALTDDVWPQIYSMTSDGRSVQRLSRLTELVQDALVSPDGRKVAFNYAEHSGMGDHIYLLDVAGGSVTRLDLSGTPVAWSPDSSRMAYLHEAEDYLVHLYLADADGANAQRLFLSTDAYRGSGGTDWSPDGRFLVYSVGPPSWWATPNPAVTTCDVYIADLVTGEVRQLTDEKRDGACYAPKWSPDGQWIAVSCDLPYPAKEGIFLIHPDGSEWQRVATPPAVNIGYMDWSPDSKRIVYQGYTTGSSRQIYIVDVEGQESCRLTSFRNEVGILSVFGVAK